MKSFRVLFFFYLTDAIFVILDLSDLIQTDNEIILLFTDGFAVFRLENRE